jgi:hypothetical protein
MKIDFFFFKRKNANFKKIDKNTSTIIVEEIVKETEPVKPPIEDLHTFLTAQVHAMDKSVYIESQKARKNLRLDNQGKETQDFFFKWIQEHAAAFNTAWAQSICKDCSKVTWCYDCLRDKCDNFNKK